MDKRKNIVYLSLGTNLGDRNRNIDKAISLIKEKVGKLVKQSSIYETEGWGDVKLNFFYNVVVIVESSLSPLKVLKETQLIEKFLGRDRKTKTHYENRVMDIDILFFNDRILNSSDLIIPHPQINFRKFVLMPLQEISPEYVHPVAKKPIAELYLGLKDNGTCIKLS